MPKKYIYTKKTGRPTKYKREMIEAVDEYLEVCKDEWENIKNDRNEKKLKVKLPSFEGFAIFLDTLTTNLTNWGEKHKKFLVALSRIPQEQKKRLMEMGLSGDYNSTIAKLILSANHNMRDQVGIDHTTKGERIGLFDYTKQTNKSKQNEDWQNNSDSEVANDG